MEPTTLRRTGALLVSAALLASLAVATVAAPAAAQGPTCDGRPATITDNDGNDTDPTVGIIVGTSGPDVIVGSDLDDLISGLGGNDIICGGKGEELMDGGAGNDRLFGGSGDDMIWGRSGHDDIFGFAGDDTIYGGAGRDFVKGGGGKDAIRGNGAKDILKGNGGSDLILGNAGNDSLNGGAGTDECRQGPGSGPIRNCERADLKVRVIAPSNVAEGAFEAKVRVKNLGPDPSAYLLELDDVGNEGVSCSFAAENEVLLFARLRPGAVRTRTHEIDCTLNSGSGSFELVATLDAFALDPRPANDEHRLPIDVN